MCYSLLQLPTAAAAAESNHTISWKPGRCWASRAREGGVFFKPQESSSSLVRCGRPATYAQHFTAAPPSLSFLRMYSSRRAVSCASSAGMVVRWQLWEGRRGGG